MIGPQSYKGIDSDATGIFLYDHDGPMLMSNIWMLNNEIRNCADGIQTFDVGDANDDRDYRNIVISGNEIYVDTDVYTDGTGFRDHGANGTYALTENALDIKGGSQDSTERMIITNNIMHGFRQTDQNGGASGSWGNAVIIHSNAKNIDFTDNIIYNSNNGLALGKTSSLTYGTDSVNILRNIFYNCGHVPGGSQAADHKIHDAYAATYDSNIMVDTLAGKMRWQFMDNDCVNLTVTNNILINMGPETTEGGRAGTTTISDNWFYGTTRNVEGDGTYYADPTDADMRDTTFSIKKISSWAPQYKTLDNVVTSTDSPHY